MKVVDIMKEELGGKYIAEFGAWKAKMHAYRKLDKKLEDKLEIS